MSAARRWAPAALGIALVGCVESGSPRLDGRWRGVRAEGVAGEASSRADSFAFHTQLRFQGGTLTVISPHRAQTGRYRVVREDSASLVLVTDADGPTAPETFTFHPDGTMRWGILPGRTIVFARE